MRATVLSWRHGSRRPLVPVGGGVVDILCRDGPPARPPCVDGCPSIPSVPAAVAKVVIGHIRVSQRGSVSALLGWLGNMLIDKNRITVGVEQDEACGPGRLFIGLGL